MPVIDSDLGQAVKIYIQDVDGKALYGTCIGTPPTTANEFAEGAMFVDTQNKVVYLNTGTAAAPSWNSMHEIKASDIADSEAVTATADGLTTGLVTSPTSLRTFVAVTSANAAHVVTLPAASAASIGAELWLTVGANGYEIRTPADSGETINLVDADGTNEMAVAANTTVRLTQVSATGWIAETIAATSIAVSAPDTA